MNYEKIRKQENDEVVVDVADDSMEDVTGGRIRARNADEKSTNGDITKASMDSKRPMQFGGAHRDKIKKKKR